MTTLLNRQYSKILLAQAVRRAFEGDDAVVPPATPPATPPTPVTPPATPSGKTYTETEYNNLVNSRLAEERRKLTDANKKTVLQLEELKKNQQLTAQEKETLQGQIDELTSTFRSAEESKKIELDQWQKKFDTETKKLKDESSSWKNRFENRMVSVDINRAAIEHKAVSPEQIEAFLRPLTRVVERLDDAGKPTGDYITKVKFEDTDGEGKPVVLDLSTNDAVKLMKERTTRFGNLFQNPTGGGVNQTPNTLPMLNGKLDLDKMSPDDYRKNRTAIREKMRADSQKR